MKIKKTSHIPSLAVCIAAALLVAAAQPAVPSATAAPTWDPAGVPQAKQPNWKSRAEYDAFQAMSSEKDPNKQIADAQAFLEKYKDSDFKDLACLAMMQAYFKLGDSAKAIDAARQALSFSPDNLDALAFISYTFPYVFNAKAPTADADLSGAESNAKHGLDVLQNLQKPANVTDDQFSQYVKPKRAAFNTALGFVDVQKKDYAGALTALKAAAGDNPNDNLIFSLMGQSYLFSKPPDYDNAIWYLARSVALAQAAKSPNADALQKFYAQVYENRHGSDAGEKDIVAQAASTVDPPPGFKVASAPKHAPTGNQLVDTFYSWEDALKAGGDTETQQWAGLKGQPFEAAGVVDSIEKTGDTYAVHIDITPESKAKEGQYDIELKDSTQPDAKYLSKGDPVTFKGTINAYTLTPSFVVTLDPGTIGQESLDSAKAKAPEKKPAPKRRH